MKKIFIAVQICICASIVFAHQEKTYLFRGKLKKDSVVIKIIGHDDIWNADYFYLETLQHNLLLGSIDSTGKYTFTSKTDSIIGSVNDNEWKLKWYKNGKKHKLKLTSYGITNSDSIHPFGNRSNHLQFATKSTESKIEIVTEKLSHIDFFRIKNADALNAKLQSLHTDFALKTIDCESSDCFTASYDIKTLNEHVLSFSLTTTQVINKINTIVKTDYFNYDISTGEPLHIEDFIFFAENEAPSFQSQDWYSYRYKVFGDSILPYLKVEDTCLDNPKYWQFPTWYILDDALMLSPFVAIPSPNCNMNTWKAVKIRK